MYQWENRGKSWIILEKVGFFQSKGGIPGARGGFLGWALGFRKAKKERVCIVRPPTQVYLTETDASVPNRDSPRRVRRTCLVRASHSELTGLAFVYTLLALARCCIMERSSPLGSPLGSQNIWGYGDMGGPGELFKTF